MNKFIDNIMNFINENTTLLIIICVFLIFVLIAYLIDNGIKTKKLAKMQNNVLSEEEKTVVSGTVIAPESLNEPKIETEEIPKESEPTIQETVSPVIETKEQESIKTEESSNESELEKTDSLEVINENDMYEPIEGTGNELVVDPTINDILLKDFTKNDTIKEIDKVEEEQEEVTLNPIDNISTIEPKKEEIVLPTPEIKFEPELPKVEVKEEKKSPYKNDKKLSDIFSKKKDNNNEEDKLLNTMSLENELDRILSKLNNETNNSDSKDSTLDETMDFSNMF